MKPLYWIALVLVVVGAVNWGLVGLFDLDLVAAIFGARSPLSRVVYSLVGLAGLVLLGTSLAGRTSTGMRPALDHSVR